MDFFSILNRLALKSEMVFPFFPVYISLCIRTKYISAYWNVA